MEGVSYQVKFHCNTYIQSTYVIHDGCLLYAYNLAEVRTQAVHIFSLCSIFSFYVDYFLFIY